MAAVQVYHDFLARWRILLDVSREHIMTLSIHPKVKQNMDFLNTQPESVCC